MGGSSDGIRVKNGANTLLDFPDAATTFAPVVMCIWKAFSENLPLPVQKKLFILS